MRTKAWRRAQRERVIRRRLSIINYAWIADYFYSWPRHRGRLDKFNLVCSCGMCRQPKYNRSQTRRL